MGATCAKGSKTADPDKTPYGAPPPKSDKSQKHGGSKRGRGRKGSDVSGEGARTSGMESREGSSRSKVGEVKGEVEVNKGQRTQSESKDSTKSVHKDLTEEPRQRGVKTERQSEAKKERQSEIKKERQSDTKKERQSDTKSSEEAGYSATEGKTNMNKENMEQVKLDQIKVKQIKVEQSKEPGDSRESRKKSEDAGHSDEKEVEQRHSGTTKITTITPDVVTSVAPVVSVVKDEMSLVPEPVTRNFPLGEKEGEKNERPGRQRSPVKERGPAVDMNVEQNMAIFDAMRSLRTSKETSQTSGFVSGPHVTNGSNLGPHVTNGSDHGPHVTNGTDLGPQIKSTVGIDMNVVRKYIKPATNDKQAVKQATKETPETLTDTSEQQSFNKSKLSTENASNSKPSLGSANTENKPALFISKEISTSGLVSGTSNAPALKSEPIVKQEIVSTSQQPITELKLASTSVHVSTSKSSSSLKLGKENLMENIRIQDQHSDLTTDKTTEQKLLGDKTTQDSSRVSSSDVVLDVSKTVQRESLRKVLDINESTDKRVVASNGSMKDNHTTEDVVKSTTTTVGRLSDNKESVGQKTSIGQTESKLTEPLTTQQDQKTERLSKLPTSRVTPHPISPTSPTSSNPSVISSATSPVTSPVTSSVTSPVTSPRSQVSSLSSDKNWTSSSLEPALVHSVQSLLIDLSEVNRSVIRSSEFCVNTRTKLHQAVEKWLMDHSSSSRVLAIHGVPGIGKTCFAAEMCRTYCKELLGCHFFHYLAMNTEHNSGVSMLLSLTFNLAFNSTLTQLFPDYLQHMVKCRDKLLEMIGDNDVTGLFQLVITTPLSSVQSDHPMLLIIDGLDQCDLSHRNALLQLVNSFDKITPDWLHLLVTLTSDNELVSQLGGIQLIEVKGSSEAMTSDLKRYFKAPMTELIDRISLDGAQTQLMQHSHGSFLCAHLIKGKLESLPGGSKLALRDVTLFPAGLSELCKESFQRLYEYMSHNLLSKECESVYRTYVGLLAVIEEPIDSAAFSNLCSKVQPMEALAQLGACLRRTDNCVAFYHREILVWLQTTNIAHLRFDQQEAQKKMADLVMVWLEGVVGRSAVDPVTSSLQDYALKHCICHLTDVAKQQDNVAMLLCSIKYIHEKMRVPGVTVATVLKDYQHYHYQDKKLVTLDIYMKKHPDHMKQIEAMQTFLQDKQSYIQVCPRHALQVAANHATSSRVRENARAELGEKVWLEDTTLFVDTPSVSRSVGGEILDCGMTSDKKMIALITCRQDKHVLHVVNTLDMAVDSFDITSVPDRSGSSLTILPDNLNVFLGSLTHYVAIKTGKPVSTGLSLVGIPIKEVFSVECCDSSSNLLCCGVTTLPFNGRSLHILVFDLKAKKCVKTLEVLKFKFGGSPLLGNKSCALSGDARMLCALVKHTHKAEMKVMMWSTSSWDLTQSVVHDTDAPSKCRFVNDETILIGAGCRHGSNVKTILWTFADKMADTKVLSHSEKWSLFDCKDSQVTLCQCFHSQGPLVISKWKKWSDSTSPDEKCVLHGLQEASDVMSTNKAIFFICRNFIKVYQMSDLVKSDHRSSTNLFPVDDVIVTSFCTARKSDDVIASYQSLSTNQSETYSISLLSLTSSGLQIAKTIISEEKLKLCTTETTEAPYFPGSRSEICQVTPDGGHVIHNKGQCVEVIAVSSGTRKELPVPDVMKLNDVTHISCAVSSKDSLVALLYNMRDSTKNSYNSTLYLYDTKQQQTTTQLLDMSPHGSINDFYFLPTTGHLVVYSKTPSQSLTTWNQRTATLLNEEKDVDLDHVTCSPSSDRLAVVRRSDAIGQLVLRSADNSFSKVLSLPYESLFQTDKSGRTEKSTEIVGQLRCMDFSIDGTVLIGLYPAVGHCGSEGQFVEGQFGSGGGQIARLWNAGNGDVLTDLTVKLPADIHTVTWLTNRHALLADRLSIKVCDVQSDELSAVLPTNGTLTNGVRVTGKTNVILGCTETGALKVTRAHNMTPIKMKTTLQILKTRTSNK